MPNIKSEYNWFEEKVVDNCHALMSDALSSLIREDAVNLDIAVGFFFLSGFHLIEDAIEEAIRRNPECKIRLLMGDRTDARTAEALDEGYNPNLTPQQALEAEIQSGSASTTTLQRLSAWIREGRFEVKVYKGNDHSFHAKVYLIHRHLERPDGFALIGSSNLSKTGLMVNMELNALTMDAFSGLSHWFERIWESTEAKTYSRELLQLMENEIKTSVRYLPASASYRMFAAHFARKPLTPPDGTGWSESLFNHQRVGVAEIVARLERFGTAILADGVGLGKTRTAAAVIRQMGNPKTIILVPGKLRHQWNVELNVIDVPSGVIAYYSKEQVARMSLMKLKDVFKDAKLVIIDEAHQGLRYSGSKQYRYLQQVTELYPDIMGLMLTATPYNNSRRDVYNIGRLFLKSEKVPSDRPYQEYLGFANRKAAKGFELDNAAFQAFWRDLFLQRTRRTFGGKDVTFATREFPIIEIRYDPDKEKAFELNYDRIGNLHLPYMNVLRYFETEEWEELSSKQLKMLMLKRADSSWAAFLSSIRKVRNKTHELLATIERLEAAENVGRALRSWLTKVYDIEENMDDFKLWVEAEEELTDFEVRSRQQRARYVRRMTERIESIKTTDARRMFRRMRRDASMDLLNLESIEESLALRFERYDEKYEKVRDEIISYVQKKEKVLIISQFRDTVLHYFERLVQEPALSDIKIGLVTGQAEDGRISGEEGQAQKEEVLQRFAPIAKEQPEFFNTPQEIQVVLGTETLSVGQNLQDCRVLMNLDLPYNPMNVEQRIGRIDRPRRDGQVNEVFILSFPSLAAIQAELQLVERLGQKIKGIYQDTAFDELVMPEYRHYLEEAARNGKVTGSMVSKMVDEVVDNSGPGIVDETHSPAYLSAMQRLWDTLQNTNQPKIDSFAYTDASFGRGGEDLMGIKISFRDANGAPIDEPKLIPIGIGRDGSPLTDLVEIESKWYSETEDEVRNSRSLSIENAEMRRQSVEGWLESFKNKQVDNFNENLIPKRNHSNLIDTKVQRVIATIMDQLNGQNRNIILNRLRMAGENPAKVSAFVESLRTIDNQDAEYTYVEELYIDIHLLWENFGEYYNNIVGETKTSTKPVQRNLRLASKEHTNIELLISHLGRTTESNG